MASRSSRSPRQSVWAGTASIRGGSESVRMIWLNFCYLGLQFAWSIEMAYCTPYLLRLGLSKSSTSMVWLAGPLSGLIMQPVVGIIADNSTSKFGRRRPIMFIGAVMVALCLILLAWVKEVVGIFGLSERATNTGSIVIAVISIYILDFAINAVQACCRSLIVDVLPASKQQLGTAWSSRLGTAGHLISYGFGSIKLEAIFGNLLGDSQFKRLCFISVVAILVAVFVTCYAVTEQVLVSKGTSRNGKQALEMLKVIFKAILQLPTRIKTICFITFWTWIGWFPFLFYNTTWIGEIYYRHSDIPQDKDSKDVLGDMGRLGSLTLVLFSSVTMISAVVLPWLTKSNNDEPAAKGALFLYSLLPAAVKTKFSSQPSLLAVWAFGHFSFAAIMIFTPFVRSYRLASAMVMLCGIPWAVITWAPYSVMGEEINNMGQSQQDYRSVPEHDEEDSPEAANLLEDSGPRSQDGGSGELSGLYLGILNIFTTLPQFVGVLISSIVFAIFEPGKSPELSDGKLPDTDAKGPNAISICFAIGALSSLMAGVVTLRLRAMK